MNQSFRVGNARNIRYAGAIMLFMLCAGNMFAQDSEPLRLYMNIVCKQKGFDKELKATVRARIGENNRILPVSDLAITFYNETDTSEILLGTALSNEDGEAVYQIEEGTMLNLIEGEGYRFTASFEGNDKFRRGSADVTIKEAFIEIGFDEIDSVKVVRAEAYELDPLSRDRIPIDGVNIVFYVPGSFSLYRFAECGSEDGECHVDFPVTLPGDPQGNLAIMARIEEHEDYGNVEASAIKDWGTVREPVVIEERRGLGDTDAPLWMVYTLIVLLSAVWIHYIYVFVVIYFIKRDGKLAR